VAEAMQFDVPKLSEGPYDTECISIEGLKSGNEPGLPMLPSRSVTLAAPPGKRANGIVTTEQRWKTLPGTHEIAWAPPMVSTQNTSMPLDNKPNQDIYASDDPYPTEPARISGVGKMGNVSVYTVSISPVRYYPASGTIEYCEDVEYEVMFSQEEPATTGQSDAIDPDIIENASQAESWYSSEDQAPSSTGDAVDYLIITTSSLTGAISPLVTYKQSQGLSVLTQTVSWIESNVSGVDTQEKVRNYIKDNYEAWGTDYLLIVGTDASIPMRRCYADTGYGVENDYIPTDYYYSDLSGDWDLNDDGKYGERYEDDDPGGVDFYPEVYVGRIPVDSAAEVTSICNKTVAFSQDNGAWKQKMLLVGAVSNYEDEGSIPMFWADTWGSALCEYIKNDITSPLGYSNYTLYEKSGVKPDPLPCDAPLTQTNTVNEWSTGYGAICYWGHGNDTSSARTTWASDGNGNGIPDYDPPEMYCPNFIHASDAPSLDNTKPGIVFAVSCGNGYPENPNSITASLLKNGAVAMISGSRVTFYSIGWENPDWGSNAALGYYFYDCLTGKGQRAGKAIKMASIQYLDEWATHKDYANLYGFNYYGDPSIQLEGEGDPTVDTVSPDTYPNDGTIDIDVSGTNFMLDAELKLVKAGETDIEATSVVVSSTREISGTLELTGVIWGQWDVVVVNPDDGSGTLAGGFTVTGPAPTVTSAVPDKGNNNDTVIVSLEGTNFLDGAWATLKKDGLPEISPNYVNVFSMTEAVCEFNLNGAQVGLRDVYFENPDTQNDTLENEFTVEWPPPSVYSITPSSGINNGTIAITNLWGSNFRDGAIVRLEKTGQPDIDAYSVNTVNPGKITCEFDLTEGDAGNWDVVVENDDGKVGLLPASFEMRNPLPSVSSVDPGTGVNNGTIHIDNISGNDFRGGASVRLTKDGEPSVEATGVSVVSTTKIECDLDLGSTAPSHWNLEVENPGPGGGTDSLTDAFLVTNPPPTVTSINPTQGTNDGVVTITDIAGDDFRAGATVKLTMNGEADVEADGETVLSEHSISCTVTLDGSWPPVAAGNWDIVVENPGPGGGAGTLSEGFQARNPEPGVTSIDPVEGTNNGEVHIVALTGSAYRPGITARLERDGETDINAHTLNLVSDTHVDCNFELNNKEAGNWNVVVETPGPGGGTATIEDGFLVKNPIPVVGEASPDRGNNNEAVEVSISGDDYREGASVKIKKGAEEVLGTGVVVEDQQIDCTFDLTGATIGDWDVVVNNTAPGGGEATKASGFNVEWPPPTVDHADPDNGLRDTVQDTRIYGTDFRDGLSVKLTYPGEEDIAATVMSVESDTEISCSFNLSGAKVGSWGIVVANNDGKSGTKENNFSVSYHPPEITSISPESKPNTGYVDVTINGANFLDGVSANLSGNGFPKIGATNLTVHSEDRITCKFDVDRAPAGMRNVTVTNADENSDTSINGFGITRGTPVLDKAQPISGDENDAVTLTGLNFGNERNGSVVRFNGTPASDYVSWNDTSVRCRVPDNATSGPLLVTTDMGTSNSLNFSVLQNDDSPLSTWYLAEGSTDWGFTTYISIINPNEADITAKVTYMTDSGPVRRGDLPIDAMSQVTINPQDDIGAADFSTKVECLEGKTIAADRTMIWTGEGAVASDAHCSIGVTNPEMTWYLAEGSSDWGFETWLLIQNPQAAQAHCSLTFMIEGGGEAQVFDVTIPANTRRTYNMADFIGEHDASMRVSSNVGVIAERTMYRNNRREGHCSIGTASPSNDYFLAEGTTDWGFTTYVLIQNPHDEAVPVEVSFNVGQTYDGPASQPLAFTMEPNSRKTIKTNDVPELANKDFSTKVNGSKPIIAERAMYWDNGTGEACHASVGLSEPHKRFYLPLGKTSEGWETFVLVQNPNDKPIDVKVRVMRTDYSTQDFTYEISANSRITVTLSQLVPESNVGITVESNDPIMVERAMYFNNRGGGTDTIGGFED